MITKKYLDDKIDDAVAQISKGVEKALDNVATKDDVKKVVNRLDKVEERLGGVEEKLGGVEERLGGVETELSYVKSDVRDLKADSPTAGEFRNHEVRITKLETFHASA